MFINRLILHGLHIHLCPWVQVSVRAHQEWPICTKTPLHTIIYSSACLRPTFQCSRWFSLSRKWFQVGFCYTVLFASYSQDQTSFFCYSHPVSQTQRLDNYLVIKGECCWQGWQGRFRQYHSDVQLGKLIHRWTASEKSQEIKQSPEDLIYIGNSQW